MKQMAYLKMKLISSMLLFFLMEIYYASGYLNVEFAKPRQHSKKHDANEKPPHSLVKRQADPKDFRITISKNPSQSVKLRLDTGSSGMWVFSERYDSCDPNSNAVRTKHSRYNSNISASYIKPKSHQAHVMKFLEEFAFGYWATDNITFVGPAIKKKFLEVTKASKYLTDLKYDGVLGLRYDPHDRDNYDNVIAEVCKGRDRAFSFSYSRNPSEAGTLTVCGSDNALYNPDSMEIIKEVEPGTWLIPVKSIVLGHDAIVEYGTKLLIQTEFYAILVPRQDIETFNYKLKNYFPELSIESQFDCQIVPRLPYLNFVIGKKPHVLEGEYFTREVESGTTEKRCEFILKPSAYDYWSVGSNFMRKFYVTFDMDHNQIVLYRSTRT